MTISLPGAVRLRPHTRDGFIDVGASASAPFDPLSLSPAVWFKADAITGKNDGDAISSWADSSGNGRNATQATGANQPLYKTAVQNGLPAVLFDGSNDFLTTSAFGRAQPATLVITFKMAATAPNLTLTDGQSAGSRFAVAQLSGANYLAFAGASLVGGTLSTAWRQMSIVFNGASSAIYINGTSVATGDAGAASLDGLTIGGRYTGLSDFMNGYIGELFLSNGALSTANRQLVEAFQKTRWGTP